MHCTHFACLFIHFSNTLFCQNHVSSRSKNKAQICNILHSSFKCVLYIIATFSSTTDGRQDMCLYFVHVLPSLKLSFHLPQVPCSPILRYKPSPTAPFFPVAFSRGWPNFLMKIRCSPFVCVCIMRLVSMIIHVRVFKSLLPEHVEQLNQV